jgi:uncharacterized protein YbjT (DUF2867 family)
MIAVMGATGHTGRRIAEQLLLKGENVRALGRSAAKLASLAASGAEIAIGDVVDADFLTKAFRGANAVYTLLPTDRRSVDYSARQDDEGRAIAKAIRESGVRFVVALSSVGAELPAGTGIITGHYRLEERLRAIDGVNVCLLRPVSFFENILEQLPFIEQLGVVADTVAPDLPFPMVATRDIAAAAANALVARNCSRVARAAGPYPPRDRDTCRRAAWPSGPPVCAAVVRRDGGCARTGRPFAKLRAALWRDDAGLQRGPGATANGPNAREQHCDHLGAVPRRSARRTGRARSGSDDRTVIGSGRRVVPAPPSTAAHVRWWRSLKAKTPRASIRL